MRLLSSFGNAALVSPAYAVNRYFQIGSGYRHMLVVGFCIDALSLLVPLPLLLQLLSFQGSLLRYHFKHKGDVSLMQAVGSLMFSSDGTARGQLNDDSRP